MLRNINQIPMEIRRMLAEWYLKKREAKGEAKRDQEWREWYNANTQHMNGTAPPPEPPSSDHKAKTKRGR